MQKMLMILVMTLALALLCAISAGALAEGYTRGVKMEDFTVTLSDGSVFTLSEALKEKKAMLLSNGIALWDVLDSCDIVGSSDSSIRNAVPVDIALILRAADIRRICCNGTAAYELFMKHLAPVCGMTPVKLPSTSPANAAWTMDRLYEQWKQILTD